MSQENLKNDISKIIKRLTIIKNLISLEEDEDIEDQIEKIEQLQIDEPLQEILNHLKQKAYGYAVAAIEKYINTYQQVAIYIDPEIEALRFEAKTVELQIQQLSDEKTELEKLIHAFSIRHNQELGELVIKILKYRKETTKEGTEEHEEAKNDYESFKNDYETTRKEDKIDTLTDEQLKELKDNYRKASKLCHPDVVMDELKEMAHNIFQELNAAYNKNDLKRVSEILESIEQGKIFISKADVANEKKTLLAELERLRFCLNELNKEVAKIRTSDTYKKIVDITDWDEYFSETKAQLQEQLNHLENGTK
jgi:hypothetical protein